MKIFLTLLLLPAFIHAAETIPIWPDAPPGNWKNPEPEKADTNDHRLGGTITRISKVSTPTLEIYPAAKEKATGHGMIICPGGGYHILAYDLEGTDIARFLASQGITAFVLKYRLPIKSDPERWHVALQDAQRSVSLVRSRAEEWGLKADKIGIMGFSAGGHLATATATRSDKRNYSPTDKTDEASCRPDFAGLIYPAYLIKKDIHQISEEITLDKKSPPFFIAVTSDDKWATSGVGFYLACREQKHPCELHIYPKGGHGYGLRDKGAIGDWGELMARWILRQ